MHYTRRQGWKFLLVYPLLAVFLICFTTPEYLTTKFQELLDGVLVDDIADRFPNLFRNYLPAFFLMIVSKLCPTVLAATVQSLGYWRQSKINR